MRCWVSRARSIDYLDRRSWCRGRLGVASVEERLSDLVLVSFVNSEGILVCKMQCSIGYLEICYVDNERDASLPI